MLLNILNERDNHYPLPDLLYLINKFLVWMGYL